MSFTQGQIIHHNFKLPHLDESELHPVIIISNEYIAESCDMYVGLMITSSSNYENDFFTYKLEDKMILNNKLSKENRFVRLHLIAYFSCDSVRSDIKGTVKDTYLNLILNTQRDRVFNNEED